jgi:hypothetical protein
VADSRLAQPGRLGREDQQKRQARGEAEREHQRQARISQDLAKPGRFAGRGHAPNMAPKVLTGDSGSPRAVRVWTLHEGRRFRMRRHLGEELRRVHCRGPTSLADGLPALSALWDPNMRSRPSLGLVAPSVVTPSGMRRRVDPRSGRPQRGQGRTLQSLTIRPGHVASLEVRASPRCGIVATGR